jgi:two-component system sensor histidine kinase GlrK
MTMRLLTRLLISHTIPVLVLTLALGVALAALLRIAVVLTTLREKELAVLHHEGELHGVTWALDRALRHAMLSCAKGEESASVSRTLTSRSIALRKELSRAPAIALPLREVVSGFISVADEALAGDVCHRLLETHLGQRRADLDERLTDFWVTRLGELHRALEEREGDAQRVAVFATVLGIPLALLSIFFALWTARKLARLLEEPLRSLAATARRVGSGDFATPVQVTGPPEILLLADALESMRSQLLELEELKQGFLASVSHELRTPLSKIREALALLQDGAVGALEERQARVVHIARAACEREIRMVTTLLDLSRLRAGSPTRLLDGESVDVALDAAVEDERIDAEQRGVEIELEKRGDCGSSRLDPELLERAIANVVRNAVSVSPRGGTVHVERVIQEPSASAPRGLISITVTDHGPGVPPEIRGRLFDAFITRQVPNSGKSVGVGLGLALAREVLRAHGGDLTLVGTSGQGTTFRLSIPRDEALSLAEGPLSTLHSTP